MVVLQEAAVSRNNLQNLACMGIPNIELDDVQNIMKKIVSIVLFAANNAGVLSVRDQAVAPTVRLVAPNIIIAHITF